MNLLCRAGPLSLPAILMFLLSSGSIISGASGCSAESDPAGHERFAEALISGANQGDTLMHGYQVVSEHVVVNGLARAELSDDDPLLIPGAVVVVTTGDHAGYYISRGIVEPHTSKLQFERTDISHVVLSGTIGGNTLTGDIETSEPAPNTSEMHTRTQQLVPQSDERRYQDWLLNKSLGDRDLADGAFAFTPLFKVEALDASVRAQGPRGEVELGFTSSWHQPVTGTTSSGLSCLGLNIERLILESHVGCRAKYIQTYAGNATKETTTCFITPDPISMAIGLPFPIPPGVYTLHPPQDLYEASRQCQSMLEHASADIETGEIEASVAAELFMGAGLQFTHGLSKKSGGKTLFSKKKLVLLTPSPPIFAVVDVSVTVGEGDVSLEAGGTFKLDGKFAARGPTFEIDYLGSSPCVVGKTCLNPAQWAFRHNPLELDSPGWNLTPSATLKGSYKLRPVSLNVGVYFEAMVGANFAFGPYAELKWGESEECSPVSKLVAMSVEVEPRVVWFDTKGEGVLPDLGYIGIASPVSLYERCLSNDCEAQCVADPNPSEPTDTIGSSNNTSADASTHGTEFGFTIEFDTQHDQDIDLSLELPSGDNIISYSNTAAKGWRRDSTDSYKGTESVLFEGTGRPEPGRYILKIHNRAATTSTYTLYQVHEGIVRAHASQTLTPNKVHELDVVIEETPESVTGIGVETFNDHVVLLKEDDLSVYLHQKRDLPSDIGFAACSSASSAMLIASLQGGIKDREYVAEIATSLFEATANTEKGLLGRDKLIAALNEYGVFTEFDDSLPDQLWERIKGQLLRGIPVILGTRNSASVTSAGHYVLVVGMSGDTHDSRALYLYDPMGQHQQRTDAWDEEHDGVSLVPFAPWVATSSDGIFVVHGYSAPETHAPSAKPNTDETTGGGGGGSW